MPYIKQEYRDQLDPIIKELIANIDMEKRAGRLNYVINQLMLGLAGNGKYKDLNELIGALEAAKLEFYRRKVGPYEDKAVEKNGDLPGFAN